MCDYNTEPYQQEVDQVQCKHCGGRSAYDFCSEDCMRAYWLEMD